MTKMLFYRSEGCRASSTGNHRLNSLSLPPIRQEILGSELPLKSLLMAIATIRPVRHMRLAGANQLSRSFFCIIAIRPFIPTNSNLSSNKRYYRASQASERPPYLSSITAVGTPASHKIDAKGVAHEIFTWATCLEGRGTDFISKPP